MLGFGLGIRRCTASLGLQNLEASSLTYDFTAGVLPAGVSILRDSAGSYTSSEGMILSAPADTARFDCDPITGEALGLLLEAEQSNVILYSAASTSGWVPKSLTVNDLTLDALGRFDGLEVISTARQWGSCQTSCALQANVDYTLTLYLRAGTVETCRLLFAYGSTQAVARGTLSAMVLSREDAGLNLSIVEQVLLADGVTYRLMMHMSTDTAGTHTLGVGPDSGTAGDSVVLLAGQIETGLIASSYIDVVDVEATRAADQLHISAMDGSYNIELTYLGGLLTELEAVGLTSGAIVAPPGYLQSLRLIPV
jgi:hypothetical protein